MPGALDIRVWSTGLSGRERVRILGDIEKGDVVVRTNGRVYLCVPSVWRDVKYLDGKSIYAPRRVPPGAEVPVPEYAKDEMKRGWCCHRVDDDDGFRFQTEPDMVTVISSSQAHAEWTENAPLRIPKPPAGVWRKRVPAELTLSSQCYFVCVNSGRWYLAAPAALAENQPRLVASEEAKTGYNCYRLDVAEGFKYQPTVNFAKILDNPANVSFAY
ncbi:hypothetical protein DIPPA_05909 [Diplonema papillatum]|nr:hypothetical protein DIPPA_05909 [Diplonema papillatum]